MKKLVLTLIFLIPFVYYNANAQELKENEVPKIIVENFKKKYPNVFVHEWELKKKTMVYEAEFIMKGKSYEAHYNNNGDWIKTERDVNKSEIPEAVWDSLNKTQYANWKIDDQEQLSTPKYEIIYKIKVKRGNEKLLLHFLPDGKQIDTI